MVGTERIEERINTTLGEDAYPNRYVIYGDEGECKLPTGANSDKVIGVLQGVTDNTSLIPSGSAVEVVTKGTVYVETDSAVDYGSDAMVAGATGKACKALHVTPETTYLTGTFEETTSDAGLALVNLNRNGLTRTV